MPEPQMVQKPTVSGEKGRAHHRVLIIGGGTAGITVAARLNRAGVSDIAIIEPSDKHYYQPLWTLVGAGAVSAATTVRPEEPLIPRGVRWIRDWATEIDPEHQTVSTRGGMKVGYDFLVVAAGIQLDWHKVEGLSETLGKNGVSSNYTYETAPLTWEFIKNFRGGVALFTAPGTPIKCGGAPQKIMYLAADYFRKHGIASNSHVIFGSAGTTIFGVPEVRVVLEKVVERYQIDVRFHHELVAVDPIKKEATFELTPNHPQFKADPQAPRRVTIPYDILHVVPPQSAPDFLKQSPLADPSTPLGWVQVDKYTLQHVRYPNVFSLGDSCSAPTTRTGAAIRKQAPVLVENLVRVMKGQEPQARYDGYASCPLLTAYGRMLLAEFVYDNVWHPTIPLINTQKERYDMWFLKKYGLPWMYWNLMLKGRA